MNQRKEEIRKYFAQNENKIQLIKLVKRKLREAQMGRDYKGTCIIWAVMVSKEYACQTDLTLPFK